MLIKIKDVIFKIVYLLIIIYLLVFIPSLWGEYPLVVKSGSMEPTLNVGGILYYHKVDLDSFNAGDILVYKTKDHIISHRVVDDTYDGYITKGDANDTYDPIIIKDEQILGKGTNWCIPLIGYYADFIYTHKYILYISVIATILDLGFDYYKNNKRKEGAEVEKIE